MDFLPGNSGIAVKHSHGHNGIIGTTEKRSLDSGVYRSVSYRQENAKTINKIRPNVLKRTGAELGKMPGEWEPKLLVRFLRCQPLSAGAEPVEKVVFPLKRWPNFNKNAIYCYKPGVFLQVR